MRILQLLTVTTALALPQSAWADATKGELFGFTLGDQYSVIDPSQLQRSALVSQKLARLPKAEMPPDFEFLDLALTHKSNTIVAITAYTGNLPAKEQEAIARKYVSILEELYPIKFQHEASYFNSYNGDLNDAFSFQIMYSAEGKARVAILYRALYGTKLGTDLNQLEDSEWREQKMEDHKKSGNLKGFK